MRDDRPATSILAPRPSSSAWAGTVTDTISASTWPEVAALTARPCEITAQRSWSSRDTS